MAVKKVIELLSQSSSSWEDATAQAVTEAARTLHGIQSVYVKNFTAEVSGGKITNYRVNVKVTFALDHSAGGAKKPEAKAAGKTPARKR